MKETKHTLSIWYCLISLVFFFALFIIPPSFATEESRGITVELKKKNGKADGSVSLYKGSYALLVGVSKYTAGWPMLESIPRELDEVDKLLTERGFHVTKVMDPDADQLASSYKDFINEHGLDKENRLLFFFSGHGYTRNQGERGYLVPVDAPDPGEDLTGFLKKSLGMNQVLSWARDIESKHALFLFDSCFSGTIFKQKALSKRPKYITRLAAEPVRQFITAGSAGEEVPANSTFTPAFIDGLKYGLADLNDDGYVSATELGLHLRTEVPQHADQNPQFGKISDYSLSRGDFIFLTDSTLDVDDKDKELPAKVSKTVFRVKSEPSGASVYVDDKYQGETPLFLENISSGNHDVRVEREGYRKGRREITIREGRHVTLEFSLLSNSSGGSLTVATYPSDAEVEIVNYQAAYKPGIEIPAGKFVISVSSVGYQTKEMSVKVSDNEDLNVSVSLDKHQDVEEQPVAEYIETQVDPSYDSEEVKDSDQFAPPVHLVSKMKKIKYFSSSHNKSITGVVPSEFQTLVNQLRSADSRKRRDAAKQIYKKRIKDPVVMRVVEQQLIEGYLVDQKDKNHLDSLAWLCNILGSTKDGKYYSTLDAVANSDTNRKVKRYALKNKRYLK